MKWDDTIIVSHVMRFDVFGKMHDSILHSVCEHLSCRDLVALKLSTSYTNNRITRDIVIDNIVRETNISYALSMILLHDRPGYLSYMLNKYKIQWQMLLKGLLYCLTRFKNKCARMLMEVIIFQPYSPFEDVQYLLAKKYECCDQYRCVQYYLNDCDYQRPISHRMLLQSAIAADNRVMASYILNRFGLTYNQSDIWTCMVYGSIAFLLHILRRTTPYIKISQRMLIKLVVNRRLQSCMMIDLLIALIQRGYVVLTKRLFRKVVEYRLCGNCVIRLAEACGTDRMVRSLFKYFLHGGNTESATNMLTNSKRLKYEHSFLSKTRNDWMIQAITNKLKLQERR